jgi:hypothetical protein
MDEEPRQGLVTVLREAYLRFCYAGRDQVTMRWHQLLGAEGAIVFLGLVLLPPALSGRTLGFSRSLMANMQDLQRTELNGEELAALAAAS